MRCFINFQIKTENKNGFGCTSVLVLNIWHGYTVCHNWNKQCIRNSRYIVMIMGVSMVGRDDLAAACFSRIIKLITAKNDNLISEQVLFLQEKSFDTIMIS